MTNASKLMQHPSRIVHGIIRVIAVIFVVILAVFPTAAC